MRNVIVLGGTYDHIELIKQLKTDNFYVLLVDYFKAPPAAVYADEHLRISTRDIDAIEEIIQKYNPIHIFSACVDSSLYTLAACHEKFGFKTLFTSKQYSIISNKEVMKKWMHDHALPTGHFLRIEPQSILSEISLSLPLVVKPIQGNSSKGVSIIHHDHDWQAAINKAHLHGSEKHILVEEYVHGNELSVDILFLHGEVHVLMISEIIKPSFDSTTITENRYSVELEKKWQKDIHALAVRLGKELQLNNQLMLLQCIVNEKAISIVEFSLRIGGGNKHQLIKQVKNIDLISVYIQLMLENYNVVETIISSMFNQSLYAHIEYIYPHIPGVVNSLHISSTENIKSTTQIFIYKVIGDSLNSTENSSNRLAGILAWGNSPKEIFEKIGLIKEQMLISIN